MPYSEHRDEGQAAADDFLISWAELETQDNECIDLVPLTRRERSALLSLCRYLEWPTRWKDLVKVPWHFVGELEHKLVSFCLDDLVKTQMLIYGALTGTAISTDDNDIKAALREPRNVVHTGIGFDYWLRDDQTGKTVATSLQEILTKLDEMSSGEEVDYTEKLEEIAGYVHTVQIVLGLLAV